MRSDGHDFAERFQQIARASGWVSSPRPVQALGMWEEFVEQCEHGYELDFSEYLNDLSVRNLLQKILDDAEVQRVAAYEPFAQRIRLIGDRFRGVVGQGPTVRPGGGHWWERTIPAEGAPEFVEDVRERYSVELRTVEN